MIDTRDDRATDDMASHAYQEALDDAVDAGGCAEAWDAASTLREQYVDDREIDRRSVLRNIAAGGLTTAGLALGFSNTAAADAKPAPRARLERQYGRADEVRSMIESQGTELIDALAADGYLDSSDVRELSIDRFQPLSTITAQSDTEYYTVEVLRGPDGDVLHPEVVTPIMGETYTMRVRFRPGEGRSYAVINEEDSEMPLIIDSSDSGIRYSHPSTYAYWYCGTQCDKYCGWLTCDTDNWLRFVCREGDVYHTCGEHCTEQCG